MRAGFSIIQMSVAIMIIGMIIGAVTIGLDLKRSSEVRSVMSDVTGFIAAVNGFESKFSGYPGDIGHAARIWPATVNGDEDGQIDYVGGGVGEEYYAWQQLALAGLIKGSYTGLPTSIPSARLNDGYYRISFQSNVYGKYGHMISLNRLNETRTAANKAILSGREVYGLDLKSDDGLADSGKIMGFNEEGVPGCVTNDYTAGSGSYISTNTDTKCKIFFVVNETK